MSAGVVITGAFLLALLIFAALVLLFAAKAGGIRALWIGAEFGNRFKLGARIARFDRMEDRARSHVIKVTSVQEPPSAIDGPDPGGDSATSTGDVIEADIPPPEHDGA